MLDGVGNDMILINVVMWGMVCDVVEMVEGMCWMGGLRYDVVGLIYILKNKKNNGIIGVSDFFEGEIVEELNDYLMMFV